MHEGTAAVLVEEQVPSDGGKVQSILDMRELKEQMGSQLHATYDVLAAGWEGDEEQEDIVTGYMEMVRSAIEPVLAMRPEDIVRNRSRGES